MRLLEPQVLHDSDERRGRALVAPSFQKAFGHIYEVGSTQTYSAYTRRVMACAAPLLLAADARTRRNLVTETRSGFSEAESRV